MRVRFLFATERVVLFHGKWGLQERGSEFLWGQCIRGRGGRRVPVAERL